jgi:hypothetical protein
VQVQVSLPTACLVRKHKLPPATESRQAEAKR